MEREQVGGIVERNQPAIKKKKVTDEPKISKTKDIRSFFNNNNSNEKRNVPKLVHLTLTMLKLSQRVQLQLL